VIDWTKKKELGNYNHIGMERHWKFSCTGNKYCGVNYEEYLKILILDIVMTISMHYIVMSYGNAMQSEDSNMQGKW